LAAIAARHPLPARGDRERKPRVRLLLSALRPHLRRTLRRGRALALAGAVEVVEKLAKHIEMVATVRGLALCVALGLALDRAQHGMQRVHHRSPNVSLKRASSRTKSSKRRIAAESSRKANQASADAISAHMSSATCARSPRAEKVSTMSGMEAPLTRAVIVRESGRSSPRG